MTTVFIDNLANAAYWKNVYNLITSMCGCRSVSFVLPVFLSFPQKLFQIFASEKFPWIENYKFQIDSEQIGMIDGSDVNCN